MAGRPGIGIVGAGRAGSALALALAGAGWPPVAVSSRDGERRRAIGALLPGVSIVAEARDVVRATDLVLLAVPDDVIEVAARGLDAPVGSIVAHLSGVHPAGVLRGCVPAGVAIGAFHPLVAFADIRRASEALAGAWIAIDGDPVAIEALRDVAVALGARAVVLDGDETRAATAKAAHHAAAVLAAGGFVALLDVIVELGRVAGLDASDALAMYGSLIPQGLANAAAVGLDDALTGPIVRGDVGTLRAHLDAIDAHAPDARRVYLALALRQLRIARRRGALDGAAATELRRLLDAAGPGSD
jgi:predicted short-subunit dehydrogenase-like oxidoreductase (DUF2520 family)